MKLLIIEDDQSVAELERDIAYGMQATSVRIEAPIPGKSLVGVEVPNSARATVTLRELLESPQMQNAKSLLTVALGKDIAGVPKPVPTDHQLVTTAKNIGIVFGD